jgi:hypothetical protein
LVAVVCALALPATASGQASRTWVSGVGDDANPCSRTAPCKTFPGAISKTAAKGEINVLDPGGFGVVTVTKPITIRSDGVTGGIVAAASNGVIINAGVNDDVRIHGLDINGFGTGLNGIRVLQAGDVHISDTHIYGFLRNGIDVESANTNGTVTVSNSVIGGNAGVGVMAAPASTGRAEVTVRDSQIDDNTCGLVASSFAIDPLFNFGTRCGTLDTGTVRPATVTAFGSSIGENPRGVFANGSQAVVQLGANEVTRSGVGLSRAAGGAISSFGDNYVFDNNTDGEPSATIAKK